MQAICGYVRLDGAPVSDELLPAFTHALCPNDALTSNQNGFSEPSVAFGCSHWGGQRPVAAGELLAHDRHSGCTVVADARLDQRYTLAKQLGLLQAGPPPGAAELIGHAWQRWGVDCVKHLRGDFAFAVRDARTHLVYLGRDIMGVRPLHVCFRPGTVLAFATRIEALAGLPDIPATLDCGRIADALVPQLEGIDKTSTFYRHIKRLPPAHWASFGKHRRLQSCYWQPRSGRVPLPAGDDGWADALGDALEAAVGRHLAGPERIGTMLSGGLDSSTLAAIAADQLAAAGRPPLPSFSSIDDDPGCSETHAIRAMLGQPGFTSTVLDPTAITRMGATLDLATRRADEPFDASMALVHAQYMAAAAAGVDALVDGIDGDSLLADGSVLTRQLQRGQWRAAWHNIRGLQQVYPGFSSWRYFLLIARAAYVPDGIRRHLRPDRFEIQSRTAIDSSLIAPDLAARVNLRERFQELHHWKAVAGPESVSHEAARALAHPYTTCGLERYHRVASWHGVQPRHPLADRQVLDLCVNLPDAQRLSKGWTKSVLRRAMRERLPASVCWRRGKEHLGWHVSQQVVLRNPEAVVLELHSLRKPLAPWVNIAKLDTMLANIGPSPKRADFTPPLLNALALGRWLTKRVRQT